MKNLLHLAAPLRNVGDNALILGVRQLFKENCKLHLRPLRSTVIDLKLIDEINKNYDGLIIGGGGLLHAPKSIRDRKKDTSGTLIMMDTKNLKYLKKPLIVYGVGYNVFRGENELPKIAKESILDMMNHAIHFSVRNDGSKKRLSKFLEIDESIISEVPDPGLYVKPKHGKLSNLVKNDKNIAIQIAADRLNHRFKNKDEVNTFITNIKSFILNNQEYTCWLVPHCPIDDDFIKLNFSGFRSIPLTLDLVEATEVMGFYSKMDVVIGQRGHGNICPFGINVPVISLVSHDKNLGFMQDVGFNDYAVNASDSNLDKKLITLVKSIDSKYRKLQTEKIEKMKISSNLIVDEIVKKIKKK
jgi:polysaccharide pyruvyl transferase WcaK-like protein